ncbi:MAG: 50S ribosomal protein L15 [Candidatus Omnitrophota bacterium]|nr:50S ribosomal protein L15 [Candidatus Omnitrophota bacterium]
MNLSQIRTKVKRKSTKRLGRGTGSGWGKTAGRGNKGAGSRKGKVLPYIGFAGGNIPFLRKIPKRGFNALNHKEYQVVNLGDIQDKIKDVTEVDPKTLEVFHLIRDANKPVKVLANIKGKLSLKAIFKVDSFSVKAKELIEAAGGKIECLAR